MKTLLVDDEKLLRADLREMLRAFPHLEIVGEAADAVEARGLIARLKPDLLFLDVQMPEESGLELLASLRAPPPVIFVTAFDQHALAAFDFGAVDYLLKPIEPARLRRAVERLSAHSQVLAETESPAGFAATAERVSPLTADQKVLLRDGDRTRFVTVGSIHGAEACGAYAKLWLDSESVLIHRSLAFLEKRLPAKLFFRANRTEIVNLQHVTEVEPWFSGGLKLALRSGRQVEVSRRQALRFRHETTL